MNREIYQKQYDFELDQRIAIASSTNTPVVSITVIGSALASMVLTYHYSDDIITSFFVLFVILSILSGIIALYFIFKSFIGYSYQRVPPATALFSYFEELKNWHANNESNQTDIYKESEKDFNEYFDRRLSEAAENNCDNNLKRGNYIHDSTVAIAFALTFLILSSPFYIYSKSNDRTNNHKIEIIEPITFSGEAHSMS